MSMLDVEMSGSEEEEYVVERIEKRRILSNGKVEYFLKWKNWAPVYNTWEPEEHLHCPELIEKFLQRERQRMMNPLTVKTENDDGDGDVNGNVVTDDNRNHVKNVINKRENQGDDDDDDKECKEEVDKVDRLLYRIPKVNGFDRGLEAEHILGATDNNGLTFLIKWKGTNKTELVPSKIARYKCPHLVINFFEKHITWHNPSKSIRKV